MKPLHSQLQLSFDDGIIEMCRFTTAQQLVMDVAKLH